MAMNEDDFTNIKKKTNPEIRIRNDLEDVMKTGKVANSANGSDFRKREEKPSMQKISDGRPAVCAEDSNFSFKEERMEDDEESAVTMKVEPFQEEPLDLSSKRTKLKKMQSSTQSSIHKRKTSLEWYLTKLSSLASSTNTNSRAVQTCATPGPYKLSFHYDSLSRPTPYPKPVHLAAYFHGLGFIPGYFVPGQSLKVTQEENCMEVRLRHPRKWKEENHQLPQSTFIKTSIDPEEGQPLSLSVPDSSKPLTRSSLSHGCQPITSLNSQLSTSDEVQPIIPFAGTNQPFITSSCNRPSSFTPSTSADGQLYLPSTPNRGQSNRSNMGNQFSKYTEPRSTHSSQEQSSFVSTKEESQGPVNMDTDSTTSLPNIPSIFGNVKDWEQPNSKNEQLMKLLRKTITLRSKPPD